MAATSSNVINIDVDDVTSAERQEQMLELIEKLKKFDPANIRVWVSHRGRGDELLAKCTV